MKNPSSTKKGPGRFHSQNFSKRPKKAKAVKEAKKTSSEK
jgi:hypothetical protein